MAYTTTTINDTARDPGGQPIGFAVVVAWPRQGFSNGGTQTNAVSAVANAAGAFALTLNCTDDAGTAPNDPSIPTQPASYHVLVFDPKQGEHVFEVDCVVPHSAPPTTLAGLAANPI